MFCWLQVFIRGRVRTAGGRAGGGGRSAAAALAGIGESRFLLTTSARPLSLDPHLCEWHPSRKPH